MKLLATSLVTLAALLPGCTANKTHVDADSVALPAIEGSWTSAQNTVVEIEREGGRYEVGIEASGATPAPEDQDFPLRILKIGDADIAEVEVDRAQQGDATGVGYVFGKISVVGDTLSYQPLKQAWLQSRSTATGLHVSPLAGGRVALGVGNAAEMKSMLEAAAADHAAWDPAETWTRAKK